MVEIRRRYRRSGQSQRTTSCFLPVFLFNFATEVTVFQRYVITKVDKQCNKYKNLLVGIILFDPLVKNLDDLLVLVSFNLTNQLNVKEKTANSIANLLAAQRLRLL